MSNVLSVWSWLATVVCVCKLCHASADGRQKTAWRGPWKERTSLPAVLVVFTSPSSLGMASAQQDEHLFPTSLEMLQRNGEAAQPGCDPTEGLSAQGRTAAVNICPETLAWQHYRSRFTGGD